MDACEEYARRWAKKEDVKVDILSEWFTSITDVLKRRIQRQYIHKTYCASEQKTQAVNAKCIFKNEVHNSVFLYKVATKKKSS